MPGLKRKSRGKEDELQLLDEEAAKNLRILDFAVVFTSQDRKMCAPYLNMNLGSVTNTRSGGGDDTATNTDSSATSFAVNTGENIRGSTEVFSSNFLEAAYQRASEGKATEDVNQAFEHAETLSGYMLEKLLDRKLKSAEIRDDCSKYLQLDFEEKVEDDMSSCENCGHSAKKLAKIVLSQPLKVDKETLLCTSREIEDSDIIKRDKATTSMEFYKLAEAKCLDREENHMKWQDWVFRQPEIKDLKKKLKKFWSPAIKE